MSYIKNYMFDLAEKLGIDVNEITDQMMEDNFNSVNQDTETEKYEN